jgi:Trk K+ transport system NAD-binding subunit
VDFVPTARLVARVVVERVHEPEFAYHLEFAAGDVQVVEMVLGAGAAGRTVTDLEVAGELRVAAVQRNGTVLIPSAADLLQPGDLVAAAVRRGVAARVRRFLAVEGGEES